MAKKIDTATLKTYREILKRTKAGTETITNVCAELGVNASNFSSWKNYRNKSKAARKSGNVYAAKANVTTLGNGDKVAVFYGTPAQIAKIFAKLK